jgi:hypothetical protein
MDEFVRMIFIAEIQAQCKIVLRAASAIEGALQQYHTDANEIVWMGVQTLVGAAANISKMLWGSAGKKAQDRETLRMRLGVTEDSPLKDPAIRNDIEHFDERLEAWFAGGGRNYAGRNIGPAQAINIEGEELNSRFQSFDPETGLVSFLANAVDLSLLTAEAARILRASGDSWRLHSLRALE